MPSVSVILPFIDEYTMLREAIASVALQGDHVQELIIVRNHSQPTDESLLPQTRIPLKILHQPLQGAGYARNIGLHEATSDWVQFLDVDDLLLPGKISHQLQFPNAGAVVSPHLFQNLRGRKEKSKWLADDIWVGLLNSGLGSTSSMLWKRDALLEIGGWNTTLQSHQEYELLFRVLQAGHQIASFNRAATMVRQRASGSITQLSKPVRNAEGLQLREAMYHYLEANGMLTASRQDAFLQYIFRLLRGLYRSDRELALAKYKTYFSKARFSPRGINVPGYKWLYAIFGFERTERWIYAILKRRGK